MTRDEHIKALDEILDAVWAWEESNHGPHAMPFKGRTLWETCANWQEDLLEGARLDDTTLLGITMVHVLTPEDIYVIPDLVIDWAMDEIVRGHAISFGNMHGVPMSAAMMENLKDGTKRPDLAGAIAILCQAGRCTFDPSELRATFEKHCGIAAQVNRMQDALRGIGRACFPKEQHTSRGAAEAQMRSIVKRDLAKDNSTIHVYECPHCTDPETGKPYWHVGHGRTA